jgi:hypothetical protein
MLLPLYSAALLLCPADFRERFGGEMRDILALKLGERADVFSAVTLAFREIADVMLIALRLRFRPSSAHQPALLGLLATAVIMVFSAHEHRLQPQLSPLAAADSIDFNATDPAGAFTVTIRNGRPVAASLDNVPVPTARILSTRDSIRFLAPGGGVVLALAFDPQLGRIEWQARPEACRGQASTCVRYQ